LFERLLVALGQEFRKRRMTGHVAALRDYYRRRNRRAWNENLSEHRTWDEDVVLQWAAMLQITPLEGVYPVLDRCAPCPRCTKPQEQAAGDVQYRATFPGGSLKQCQACESAWLVLDSPHSMRARGPGVIEEPKGGHR
jgi:hypothetical protein